MIQIFDIVCDFFGDVSHRRRHQRPQQVAGQRLIRGRLLRVPQPRELEPVKPGLRRVWLLRALVDSVGLAG